MISGREQTMSDGFIRRSDAIKLCIDIINHRTTEWIKMGCVESAEKEVIEIAFNLLPSLSWERSSE